MIAQAVIDFGFLKFSAQEARHAAKTCLFAAICCVSNFTDNFRDASSCSRNLLTCFVCRASAVLNFYPKLHAEQNGHDKVVALQTGTCLTIVVCNSSQSCTRTNLNLTAKT